MTSKIYALMGPHASGKTTILKKLIEMGVHCIPVYTTKIPRSYDTDNNTTFFLSQSDFLQKDWIVKVTYKGNYYGLLKEDVFKALKEHKVCVTMLHNNGVKQLSKIFNNNLETIYIMVDYVNLIDRMIKMGHTNTDMKYHLEYAEKNGEFDHWKTADYIVKNICSLDKAINQVTAILGLTANFTPEMISKL
ncbi:MAG: guanylate kinase [Anaerovibrio sp.]|uniref:guanylate kinase n=1 Tax=Anaerovibrio sp. TaxID=1872532 RepID=UPI0025E9F3B2|nr:guanylate kinase [Anaerovibrio sp.]MCR5176066.1 guanylate kinase [Anaerovibrio sp.]